MTWSSPPTAVFQQSPPYTWWNTYVRDNLLETAPGKATTAGYHFASTGPNSIAERAILDSTVNTQETTASTTYANLATAGPAVAITTGPRALSWWGVQMGNSGTSQTYASIDISGATTSGASDTVAAAVDATAGGTLPRMSSSCLHGVTSGVNTFTVQYRVNAGTGTFLRRRLIVMAL